MKIARCTDGTTTFWAVIHPGDDSARPLAGAFADWAPILTAAPTGNPPWDGLQRPLHSLRLLAPIEPGAKTVCAGATYAAHLERLGLKVPDEPTAFLKPYEAMIGPDDEIAYPAVTEALDYEAELVAVIGSARVTDPANPLKDVLGYTAGNDVSARDLQFGGALTGIDLFSGKVLDRTTAVGPWIVTRDEFGDTHPDLAIGLTVNGEQRQKDRTSSMLWGTGELLAYANARTGLHGGDIFFTGTPAGVGHESGNYLQPGQTVAVTIEGIGTLTNTVGSHLHTT